MATPFLEEAEECLTEARELWKGEAGGPYFDLWRDEAWEGDLPRPDSQEKNGGGQGGTRVDKSDDQW